MSAPLHLLHRFTTDESGEYHDVIARHPGGLFMRANLVRADGVTDEVATPGVTLTSERDGLTTPVWADSLTAESHAANDLWEQIPEGNLTLDVVDGDSLTEYLIALYVEPNRNRRHVVSMIVGPDGGANTVFDLNDGGVLQTIAVVSSDSVDGETVDLVIHNVTQWPEVDDYTVYTGSKDVGDPASIHLGSYMAPGSLNISVESGLPDETVIAVVFDIAAP